MHMKKEGLQMEIGDGSPERSGFQRWVVHDRFFEMYDRMFGEAHVPDTLREVAEVVCDTFNAQRATIYLVEHDTMELESVALIGNVSRTIRIPIQPSSLAGFCALNQRAFVVPDAYGDLSNVSDDLAFDRSWDEINGFRTRDVMNAPVMFRDRLQGVVQVINSNDGQFGEKDLVPLQSISRMIGYALYHAKLYDDLASMKQVEKEKAGFLRIMVHELKSPVAAARMMSDVLADTVGDNANVTKMTGRIGARLDQLSGIIGDMLNLARVKQGNALGEICNIDLTTLTEKGCAQYQEQADLKGLGLDVSLPELPLVVRFDSKGYQLVVSNLLSNAIKYTPEGTVRVGLRAEDDWAVLHVKDSGIGIPEKDLPKLFKEFFRASNARKSRIQGTGVGLAGVKQMVERFGGEILLDSEENVGTTFTVRLPLQGGSPFA